MRKASVKMKDADTLELRYAQTNLGLYQALRHHNFTDAELARIHAGYTLTVHLFGTQFRADGRPFVTHAVGTAAAALAFAGDTVPDVDYLLAALLHATYDRGELGDYLPRSHPAHRALVRDVIGKTAEEMVFAYHSVPWPPSDIHLLRRQIASGALTEIERQVYTLRAVNELDDLRDLAPVYVGSVKRQSCIKGAGFAIAIAESLSATALVDALSISLAAVQSAQVSSHLSGGRDSSYTVTPVRLREQIRRALKYKFRSAL